MVLKKSKKRKLDLLWGLTIEQVIIMIDKGYSYRAIAADQNVSLGFISKCNNVYRKQRCIGLTPPDLFGVYDSYEDMIEAEINRLMDNPNA